MEQKFRLIIPDYMIVMVLLERGGMTISKVARRIGLCWSHMHHIKTELIERKWLIEARCGRTHYLSLTPKGIEVVQNINKLMSSMAIVDIMEYKRYRE